MSGPRTQPAIDLDQARTFLAALAPDGDGKFTFQIFDDSSLKDESKAKHKYATLEAACEWLKRANAQRIGVFVTVNATDGLGRYASNVIALRAVFIDGDGIPLPDKFPIAPSIIVRRDETHWHAYWLLLSGEVLAYFKAAQQSLAAFYGSDPAINDLSRVMRLPGFIHHKKEPNAVQLVEAHPERRYTLAEVLAAHGGVPTLEPKHEPIPPLLSDADEIDLAMFRFHAEATEAKQSRHHTVLGLMCEGYSRGLDPDEVIEIGKDACDRFDIEKSYAPRAAKWAYQDRTSWEPRFTIDELHHGAELLGARVAELAKASLVAANAMADLAMRPGHVLALMVTRDREAYRNTLERIAAIVGPHWQLDERKRIALAEARQRMRPANPGVGLDLAAVVRDLAPERIQPAKDSTLLVQCSMHVGGKSIDVKPDKRLWYCPGCKTGGGGPGAAFTLARHLMPAATFTGDIFKRLRAIEEAAHVC